MDRLLALTIIFLFAANCARDTRQTTSVAPSPTVINSPSPSPTNDPTVKAESTEKKVPPEFQAVDFENFSYPLSWKHQTVRLKDGHLEFFKDKIFYNGWFDLDGVDYVDLNGDGKKEAIVQLSWVSCGASCDGGSSVFYFYSQVRGKPILLSRLETGSIGYDCGLKSFVLKNGNLSLETFRSCRFNGFQFKPSYDPGEEGGKYLSNRYTRFTLQFNGIRFVLKNRRVFRFTEVQDIGNYEPKIEISND